MSQQPKTNTDVEHLRAEKNEEVKRRSWSLRSRKDFPFACVEQGYLFMTSENSQFYPFFQDL